MKFMQYPAFRILYVLIGGMTIYSLTQSVYTVWKRQDVLVERKNVLKRLEVENTRLKRALIESQTPAFIEREARNKLGMSKPGEQVVLMPNATPSGKVINDSMQPVVKPSWNVWWKLFF